MLGTLNCGGTLIVTNLTPGELATGDTFRLLDAAVITGGFSSVQLPPLGGGRYWNTNNLLVDGTITVVSLTPPTIESIVLSPEGNVRLSFSGTAGLDYEVRASTNVALTPLSSWWLIATGSFAGTPVTFEDSSATNFTQRFYVIRVP